MYPNAQLLPCRSNEKDRTAFSQNLPAWEVPLGDTHFCQGQHIASWNLKEPLRRRGCTERETDLMQARKFGEYPPKKLIFKIKQQLNSSSMKQQKPKVKTERIYTSGFFWPVTHIFTSK